MLGRLFVLAVLALAATSASSVSARPTVQVLYSSSVPSAIQGRLTQHFTEALSANYQVIISDASPSLLPAGSFVISLGPTNTTRIVITQASMARLKPEGYIVASSSRDLGNGVITIYAADGVPPNRQVTDVFPPDVPTPNTGLHYACYALLEQFGAAFLHPLDPFIPSDVKLSTESGVRILSQESPQWPIRGWHYHTEHPLDLTNFLNGWGLKTWNDEAGWQSMMPEWGSFLEWLVANRQNAIEYLLLAADDWESFVASSTRQGRFKQITSLALEWGVAVASDVPIAVRQQHAWYMTDGWGTLDDQVKQIQERIDWLHNAGFHFLSTESGFSEFTHPDCTRMVAWMNATTQYTRSKYEKRTVIKAHISTGQMCPEYADPTTGVPPCNFNFLPHYADPGLGVLPHTVQMYTFDDPAPTYGQTNFTNMFKFATVEAPLRYTLYHGETAYWVNYDIDLPLFLPYYAYGRLYDLRKLRAAEIRQGIHFMGQFNFESGWEWSYWLQNTITARAAWNSRDPAISNQQALSESLDDITRIFGKIAPQVTQWILNYIETQHNLLVLGNYNGTDPSSVVRRNGIAFLEGWDTWAQLMPVVGMGTQPLNLDISAMGLASGQSFYSSNVRPLLDAMAIQFKAATEKLNALVSQAPAGSHRFLQEIYDSAHVTQKRAEFVLAVYDSLWQEKSTEWRKTRFDDAVVFLKEASETIKSREAAYRVPLDRIAGWGRNTNPTSYDFGFVWTVHSRFYWFRDLFRAADQLTSFDPCFLNIIDPMRIAIGNHAIVELEAWLAQYLKKIGVGVVSDCISAPATEPVYAYPATF